MSFRIFGLPALLLCGLLLAGCSSSSGDDDDMIEAFTVLGQADFEGFRPNGGGSAGPGTLAGPLGNVATDGERLFVADTDNNRVLGYSTLPMNNGAPADIVLGQSDFTSTAAGTGLNRMARPSSVFIGEGRLVVADSGNNRVLIWNTVPTETGTPPDIVVGQTGFNSGTSGTSDATLRFPTSAIVAFGRLIVADQNNNRVLIWEDVPNANGMPAGQVLGQQSFTTREADDAADEMSRPSSAWSDGFRLLVADSGNNRVLYWTLFPQDSSEAADFVLGQTDFDRSAAGTSSASFRVPSGVSSDGTRIYIADSGNNGILEYGAFLIAHGASADRVFGQEESCFSCRTPNDDDQDGETDDVPSNRTLNGTSGVFVLNGVVYAIDRNNHRLLMFPQ